jgi:hypothetical protein
MRFGPALATIFLLAILATIAAHSVVNCLICIAIIVTMSFFYQTHAVMRVIDAVLRRVQLRCGHVFLKGFIATKHKCPQCKHKAVVARVLPWPTFRPKAYADALKCMSVEELQHALGTCKRMLLRHEVVS